MVAIAGALEVQVRFTNLDTVRAEFARTTVDVDRAAQLAINDTLKFGRTRIVDRVVERADTRRREVRARIKLIRAGRRSLTGIIRLSDLAIPLIAFRARKVAKGVSYQLEIGQRIVLQSAFIAKAGNRGRQVLKRARDETRPSGLVPRLPVLIRYGPSLIDMFEDFVGVLSIDLSVVLERNFQRLLRADILRK